MRHTFIRSAAVALTLGALAAPAADAKVIGGGGEPPQDLRSPDARDAAEGRGTFNAPDVIVVDSGKQSPAPVADEGGIDWGDAGIGAGVLGGIALLAGGGVLVVQRRSAPAA
jgi:hypothetical protein